MTMISSFSKILQNLKNGFSWRRVWWTTGYYAVTILLIYTDSNPNPPLWLCMLASIKYAPFYYFFYTRDGIPHDNDDDDDGDDEYTEEYLKQEHGKVMRRGMVNNA
jgi:hypothetical protein